MLAAGIVAALLLYPQSPRINPGVFAGGPTDFNADTWAQRIILAIAFALAFMPFTRRVLSALLHRLRHPSRRARRWIALFIFLVSGPWLYVMAARQHRLMQPIYHDEFMHRLQTTFLAHGKLCMPPLPLPDFFDVPYVFTHGVYAPVYFPGTSLLHVPAMWLHLPYVFMPLLIAAISLTLLYLIVTELLDGLAGLLAVWLMVSLLLFRWLALVEMSHPAGMMWGLLAIWAWLAWRRATAAQHAPPSPGIPGEGRG
ncbi:MAG TPA: hypothetical protein VFC78_00355, partial [Tepidisphaeraceae bacterium]|nr:hypothetical protein [Tepidisphaeraceae bacterium]